MRVYIYKARRGVQDVLFRPAKRRNLAMVLLNGLTRETRREAVRKELEGFEEQALRRAGEITF